MSPGSGFDQSWCREHVGAARRARVSDLARSIADGGRPAVRDVPVFGWGEVYPAIISPVWALVEDRYVAYHATLAVNALVMSLAAIPAYFLARLFVSRRSSLLVATLTVVVPSLSYTGAVLTENAFYPLFLAALLAVAHAVRSPTIATQGLALVSVGLLAFTRIQGVAMLAAYAGAVLVYWLSGTRVQRRGYLRAFLPTVLVTLPIALAPIVASVARGEGVFGWLGQRSGTFDEFRVHEVPYWFVFLAIGLVLYVAVAPAVATAVVVAVGLGSRADDGTRLFAAIGLPTIVAMLLSIAFVSASFDVDGIGNLNERYVFHVVPLTFVGLALWIERGLPRPRPWSWVVSRARVPGAGGATDPQARLQRRASGARTRSLGHAVADRGREPHLSWVAHDRVRRALAHGAAGRHCPALGRARDLAGGARALRGRVEPRLGPSAPPPPSRVARRPGSTTPCRPAPRRGALGRDPREERPARLLLLLADGDRVLQRPRRGRLPPRTRDAVRGLPADRARSGSATGRRSTVEGARARPTTRS